MARTPAKKRRAPVERKPTPSPDRKDKVAGKLSAFVKPGQQLRYVDKLKERHLWPLSRGKEHRPSREKGPTTTPYVVVPTGPGDVGSRPIPDQQALYNASVQVVDGAGNAVLSPVSGRTYRLRCRVINRGGAGAFGGVAEFYVAPPWVIDNAASTPGSLLPAKGYAGFSAIAGGSVVVECPNPWTPVNDTEAASSVVVHAFDTFVDRVVRRFDARQDRHVGRRDRIPDFSGVWDGMESANIIHQVATRIRIVVAQNYLNVSVGFYSEVGSGIPSTPQETANGIIVNGQAQLSSIEVWGPNNVPFTSNEWTLALTAAGVLHFEHHAHYLMPGDGRPDTHTNGDLHRV
jgi:hypothetical protein